jgi:PAS domain S-box-containing protein
LIFHGGFGIHDDVLAFVAFPFLIWAAIRFRIMGAVCASLLVGGIATWSTARGQGPFVEGNPVHDVVLLQVFVVLVAATTILLAAVTEEREQIRERLADHAQLLDLASDAILVRGLDDTISYWNHGAERLYGWTRNEVLHKPVQELLGTQYPQSIAEIKATVLSNQDWNGELTHTTRDGRHINVASRWSLWSGQDGKPKGFLQLNSDITAQRRTEQQLRELTGRLLKAQDDERRRIARELHDSAGQLLAALSMNLASLQPFLPPGQAADICQESEGLVQQLMRELRTLSHLLHPPLLDEVGLASAVQWFVEGFGERSHIQVALDLPEELERLPAEIETAIFRLIQEALTNIHRHSESPTATVRIVRGPETVRVEIADAGKGFAPELLSTNRLKAGVGIQGMRERIRQLGGQFEVTSGNAGTLIAASLPLSTT